MEQSIKHLLDERPWFYLDEIQEFLLEMFDIEPCLQTVANALKHIKVTRKKLKVEAAQRNDELRTQWLDDL